MTAETFAGARGRTIHWTRWAPASPTGVTVIVHGFGEHSGRYEHVAERLVREDWAVFALDHHGHGRSEGPRGRISFPDAVADLDRLLDLAAERHPDLPVFLLGHSMGGALALRYTLDHADRLSGLILSGPLVQVEGRGAAKLLGRGLGRLAPNLPLARLDPNLVSRDPEVVAAYVADPLVFHQPLPAGTVAEFLRYAATLPGEVDRVRLPTLLMYGTEDGLCAPQGAVLVSQRIGASDLTTTPYEGLYHEILNEPEQDRVLDDVCGWLAVHAPEPVIRPGA
ncbi:MAG TPA: lysophospholipase [Solirubrobacteraceae bacterium]|jgi:alpha-beta hydrolase superfamily lysophospholipase|nr:lysophospholipase [Solirubrobacteraceae bacterium]